MGLRFHKSIKLPFGFRLNLSKSGMGYSWGFKGFRISKSAKGKTRKTVTLPGTGLSYVTEDGSTSKKTQTKNKQTRNSKLKQVYLNEETGEIIEMDGKPKTFDEMVDNIANDIENSLEKK